MPGTRIGDRPKPLSLKTIARIDAGLRKYGGREPMIMRWYSPRGRIDQMSTSVGETMPTLTASVVPSLIVPVEGRLGKQARPTFEAMRTMTARAETALVVPYYGTAVARPAAAAMPTMGTVDTAGVAFIATLKGDSSRPWGVDEPLSTVAANGNHHMLVRHNSSKGDGGEMCTPATEPARTMTTTGHQSLVSIEDQVQDSTFRMLEPHEIQSAMAFHAGYQVLGTRRERVRQLGNGVTPPAAEFLLRAVAASLEAVA
jgi:DNA (cytosine-5)-methyltransferase 1